MGSIMAFESRLISNLKFMQIHTIRLGSKYKASTQTQIFTKTRKREHKMCNPKPGNALLHCWVL